MSRPKRNPLPKPLVTHTGDLKCNYCGHERVCVTNSPKWDANANKRRRYQCGNPDCRTAWFANETFESDAQQLTSEPKSTAEAHENRSTITTLSRHSQRAAGHMPRGMLIYVPGQRGFPYPALMAKLGIDHIQRVAVKHTDRGPDDDAGWIISRDDEEFVPVATAWLQVASIWIGSSHTATTPVPSPITNQPTKKRSRPSARAIARAYALLQREARSEMAEFLKNQGA